MLPFARFQISGHSMTPTFQPGNRVLIWRWGTVRQGDTVVFSKNGITMVKRAVQKNGDRWIMRGDNFSESTDSLDFGEVREDEMIGKVVTAY
jgi:signal peptidase I